MSPSFIILLIAPQLTDKDSLDTIRLAKKHNFLVEQISNLTDKSLSLHIECRRIAISGEGSEADLNKDLRNLATKKCIDISFQKTNDYYSTPRLACFDMDSTLIQTECMDELAARNGVGEQVKAITKSAMRGEIDYPESFRKRVSLLEGLEQSAMLEIVERLPITEGMPQLVKTLKKHGCKLAILSGGLSYFANYLKDEYGFDYACGNELEIVDGKLTGNHVGDIIDGQRKAELLKQLVQQEGIDLHQTIAVGDGANDLPMLALAGKGIAFHAKPIVIKNAKHSLSTVGLDGVLYLLGYKDLPTCPL